MAAQQQVAANSCIECGGERIQYLLCSRVGGRVRIARGPFGYANQDVRTGRRNRCDRFDPRKQQDSIGAWIADSREGFQQFACLLCG